ncbi:MAG: OadG family transporter subunit [Clostridia bacterium]|jgi:sodium pump decarboxylase gamma subunit|nr:OadG family transporter subunit [Clostridia bacterium]
MLGFGLTVAGIGLGTVFIELCLLIFVIYIISAVAKAIQGKKPEAGANVVQQPAAPAAVQVEALESDDDVIAVIAAAVASLEMGSIRITAIRRIAGVGGATWSQAGRLDTMYARQV